MKKNTNKSTTNNLATAAAKRKKTTNKVVKAGVKKQKSAAQIKKEAKIRNSFRRALYRANKMIASGNSFYKNKLDMKTFKKEYADFGKRTGMLKGKNLDKDLKTFVDNEISSRTPKQCASAVANLMKHLNNAVTALNRSKGGIETINDANKRYIQILIENDALKTKEKDDKKVYSIIKEKVPNKEDLLTVNNKYLKFKRSLINYFGNEEYAEAYGS